MSMSGTVRCRPTLAYRVHFVGIDIYNIILATKLITRFTPIRNWPNFVLMLDQRLQRWPILNQYLVSVPCWLGKLSLSI